MIWDAFTDVLEFKLKVGEFISDLSSETFEYFPSLKMVSAGALINKSTFCEWLTLVSTDFDVRFKDFEKIRILIDFGRDPAKITTSEIVEIGQILGIDPILLKGQFIKFKAAFLSSRDCHKKFIIDQPLLCVAYAKVLSILPSSYSCESIFSSLNFIVNEFRSVLTQSHIKDLLLIACSEIDIDLKKFVSKLKNCQFSH